MSSENAVTTGMPTLEQLLARPMVRIRDRDWALYHTVFGTLTFLWPDYDPHVHDLWTKLTKQEKEYIKCLTRML